MAFKRALAAALAAAVCLSLTGCVRAPYAPETEAEIVLPEPSQEPASMILGETMDVPPVSVTLYYVAADGTSFSTVTRSIAVSEGENICEEAVNALLRSGSSPDRMDVIPSGTQLLGVEYACGIATVNLSLDALDVQSEQEHMMMLASIGNTLLSIEGVEGVNVLIDGRSIAVAGLPTGIQTEMYSSITSAYAQISAEREYFIESQTGAIERTAALYFPASAGNGLMPELRTVSFDSSDYASGLIRALCEGPLSTPGATTAIPDGADFLLENPAIEISPAGERVLRLDFSSTLRNYLAFSGLEEWQLIGSVVLTICSFAPEIDAVSIRIGDEEVLSCTVGESQIEFEGGTIRRSDFASSISSAVALYLPHADGTFERVERAISRVRAASPLSVLYALFDGILAQSDSASVFPTGVYYDDILGVSVSDSIASVNLSANFYRQAQALDATAERGVVYAIVNTLCELEGIAGVRFYIEGISAQTLSGSIYLRSVLLPNPGLVSPEPSAVPEITATP